MNLQCFSLHITVFLVTTVISLQQNVPLCKFASEGKESGIPCALFSIKTGEGKCQILKYQNGAVISNSTTALKCALVNNEYMECPCQDICQKTVQESLNNWKPEEQYDRKCRNSALEYLKETVKDSVGSERKMLNQPVNARIKFGKEDEKLDSETVHLASLTGKNLRKKRDSASSMTNTKKAGSIVTASANSPITTAKSTKISLTTTEPAKITITNSTTITLTKTGSTTTNSTEISITNSTTTATSLETNSTTTDSTKISTTSVASSISRSARRQLAEAAVTAFSKMASTSNEVTIEESEDLITADEAVEDHTNKSVSAQNMAKRARRKLRKRAALDLLVLSSCMTFVLISQLVLIKVMRSMHRQHFGVSDHDSEKQLVQQNNPGLVATAQQVGATPEVVDAGKKPGSINTPRTNINPSVELMEDKRGNALQNLSKPSNTVLKAPNRLRTITDEATVDLYDHIAKKELLLSAEKAGMTPKTSQPGSKESLGDAKLVGPKTAKK